MKTRTIAVGGRTAEARILSKEDIAEIQPGKLAPDCFGRMSMVTRVFFKKELSCGYYTAMGPGDTISNGCGCSMGVRAGELIRTVALTGILTSADCDRLEDQLHQS